MSSTVYDGLGRESETQLNVAGGVIRTVRTYDSRGRLYRISNPFGPGETLPRWTFSLYWRKDGKPIWSAVDYPSGQADGTMVEGINDSGQAVLTDDMLHSWFLDPAIKPTRKHGSQRVINDTPLFIQNPGSWYDRPDSATA